MSLRALDLTEDVNHVKYGESQTLSAKLNPKFNPKHSRLNPEF